MIVKFQEAARNDLEDAAEFYEQQESGLGRDVGEFLLDRLGELSHLGGIHRCRRGIFRWALLGRFPHFVCYYRINSSVVEVIAVYDGRRDPKWIRKSLNQRLKTS